MDSETRQDDDIPGSETYTVKLDLFEGPLDLLLFLIRKNEIDISDIPIATITEQYLNYLNLMKFLNVNLASDFLVVASTLVHIKSRMLLPSSTLEDEGEEDPRMEIVRPLLEYMQIKEAAGFLGERQVLNRDVFVRDFMADELKELEDGEELIAVSLFDLLSVFKKIVDRHSSGTNVHLPKERVSVQEVMDGILARLRTRPHASFEELFGVSSGRSVLVVTFLAILELTRIGLVRLFQVGEKGSIRVFLNQDNNREQETE